MSNGLIDLLGKNFGSIASDGGAEEFAEKVIAAAKKYHLSLHSIPELANADLNGDGKIGIKEIAALITAAHEKRAGTEFKIVSSGNGLIDGRALRNPDYDPTITAKDIQMMMEPAITTDAKRILKENQTTPTLEQLLKGMDKKDMDALKDIRGGRGVNEYTHDSSSMIINQPAKHNGFVR